MIRKLLLVLSCAVSAFAQPTILIHLGGSAPFSETYSNVRHFRDDYWVVGPNAGIAVELSPADWVRITPSVEYSLFPLRHDFQHRFILPAVYGPPSYTGDAFHRIRMGMDFRFSGPYETGMIKPFIQIGGGYALERIGKITLTFQGANAPPIEIEAKNAYSWTYAFGLGTELVISRHLRIEPIVTYHSSTDAKLYGLFNLNLVYGLDI